MTHNYREQVQSYAIMNKQEYQVSIEMHHRLNVSQNYITLQKEKRKKKPFSLQNKSDRKGQHRTSVFELRIHIRLFQLCLKKFINFFFLHHFEDIFKRNLMVKFSCQYQFLFNSYAQFKISTLNIVCFALIYPLYFYASHTSDVTAVFFSSE